MRIGELTPHIGLIFEFLSAKVFLDMVPSFPENHSVTTRVAWKFFVEDKNACTCLAS